jgi:hypothetical protein
MVNSIRFHRVIFGSNGSEIRGVVLKLEVGNNTVEVRGKNRVRNQSVNYVHFHVPVAFRVCKLRPTHWTGSLQSANGDAFSSALDNP